MHTVVSSQISIYITQGWEGDFGLCVQDSAGLWPDNAYGMMLYVRRITPVLH